MAESETTENSAAERRNQWRKFHRGPGVVVVFFLVLAVVFFVGLVIGGASNMGINQHVSRFSVSRPGVSFSVSGSGTNFIGSKVLANENQIEGVVTAVNGSNLTIAGYGTTNTVQTNSATEYVDGSSAVVNDTVVVDGTISNNTFTATSIDINPAQ